MINNWEQLEQVPPSLSAKDDNAPTRTNHTNDTYFKFIRWSLTKIREYNNLDKTDKIYCDDIYKWADASRSIYRVNTWRVGRASFVNLMQRAITFYNQELSKESNQQKRDELSNELNKVETTIEKLKQLKWSEAEINIGKTPAKRSRELLAKTSSSKKKSVDPKIFYELTQYINTVGTDWQKRALNMCFATLFTGLRPSEWELATIEEQNQKLILTVQNAKATNGRSNGITREMTIEDEFAKKAVIDQIKTVSLWKERTSQNQTEKDFAKSYVSLCSNAIRSAQIQLFGKSQNITPYSFRHQFAANMKSAKFSKQDIANLMGHASSETAKRHYGKKRQGYSSIAARKEKAIEQMKEMSPEFVSAISKIVVSINTQKTPSQSHQMKMS